MKLKKPLCFSISGKGGAGKTSFTALLLKILLEFKHEDLLLIDADPAMNLHNVLEVELKGKTTLGMILDRKKNEIEASVQRSGKPLEGEVWNSIINQGKFDLLTMGFKKGEGCYCALDSFAASIIDSLTKLYNLILIDFYAGFEHLSRRTDRSADILLIVTDPSKMGLETSRHIKTLTEEINISFKDIFLIGNRFSKDMKQNLINFSDEIGVKFAGIIPYDQNIANFNFNGKSLIKISENSIALNATKKIYKKILQSV